MYIFKVLYNLLIFYLNLYSTYIMITNNTAALNQILYHFIQELGDENRWQKVLAYNQGIEKYL